MTISLLVYGSGKTEGTQSSYSIGITVPSGSKMRAFVWGFMASSAGLGTPSATFGGAAMTARISTSVGGTWDAYYRLFLLEKSNPSPGYNVCTLYPTATAIIMMSVAVFDNCADTTPGNVAQAYSQGTVSVPAVAVGDLVIAVQGTTDDTAPSGSQQTWTFYSVALVGNNGWGSGGTSAMLAQSTSHGMTWTNVGGTNKSHVGISFPHVKAGVRVISFLETFRKEWLKKKGLYADLMRQGAVPIGAQI